MPRTLSWLDRIVPISRTVQESARSHYDRKEIERLFELQPRAAQQLIAALPRVPVGRARLVEREALSDFLRRLNDSENPAETFARMRAEGGKTVRRKLREFSLQDYPASVDSPLESARGEGRVGGRRPKLLPQQQTEVLKMVEQGKKTAADAARLFNVHPATIGRLLARRRGNEAASKR